MGFGAKSGIELDTPYTALTTTAAVVLKKCLEKLQEWSPVHNNCAKHAEQTSKSMSSWIPMS